MTEPDVPTPAVLLATDDNDEAFTRGQLEAAGTDVDVSWTLNRRLRTDPLEYALEGYPIFYVTQALNLDPTSIEFLGVVRSQNPTHVIVVLDGDGQPAPRMDLEQRHLAATTAAAGPSPSEEHVWIYVRGAGWWDGPWTIQDGRATDPQGTVVFLEHVTGWSDVSYEKLPGQR